MTCPWPFQVKSVHVKARAVPPDRPWLVKWPSQCKRTHATHGHIDVARTCLLFPSAQTKTHAQTRALPYLRRRPPLRCGGCSAGWPLARRSLSSLVYLVYLRLALSAVASLLRGWVEPGEGARDGNPAFAADPPSHLFLRQRLPTTLLLLLGGHAGAGAGCAGSQCECTGRATRLPHTRATTRCHPPPARPPALVGVCTASAQCAQAHAKPVVVDAPVRGYFRLSSAFALERLRCRAFSPNSLASGPARVHGAARRTVQGAKVQSARRTADTCARAVCSRELAGPSQALG
jgi:hypothetical protein